MGLMLGRLLSVAFAILALALVGMVQRSPSLEPVPTVSSGEYTYWVYDLDDGNILEHIDFEVEVDGDIIVFEGSVAGKLHGRISSSGHIWTGVPLYLKIIDRDTIHGCILLDEGPETGVIIRPKPRNSG